MTFFSGSSYQIAAQTSVERARLRERADGSTRRRLHSQRTHAQPPFTFHSLPSIRSSRASMLIVLQGRRSVSRHLSGQRPRPYSTYSLIPLCRQPPFPPGGTTASPSRLLAFARPVLPTLRSSRRSTQGPGPSTGLRLSCIFCSESTRGAPLENCARGRPCPDPGIYNSTSQ